MDKKLDDMVLAKLNNIYPLIIPRHRAARPDWYTDKGWERARLDSLHSEIKPNDICFYIGAEEGEMPALISQWGAEVVLFEPNDKVWPNIKAIWEANRLKPPLFCFSGFASNNDSDQIEIYKADFPPSANGKVIWNHGFKELHHPGDISQVKIDTIVEKTGIKPTVLCLDVEGSEWEVLQGAEKTIREYKPKIWLSLHPEFLFDIYQKYSYEVRKWLIDMGYQEKLLDYQHEAHFFYK